MGRAILEDGTRSGLPPSKGRVEEALSDPERAQRAEGESKGRYYPPTKKIMPAWFYLLRLQSQHLYSGSTRSLEKRIKDHFAGRACRTTKIDPPIALVYSEEYPSYKEAFRREHQVKRWSRAKKEALIVKDLDRLKKSAKRKKA
jgi:predicted GIY-YIG superfamily endonuclease